MSPPYSESWPSNSVPSSSPTSASPNSSDMSAADAVAAASLPWQSAGPQRLHVGAEQARAELARLADERALFLYDPAAGPAAELVEQYAGGARSLPIPAGADAGGLARAVREIGERRPRTVAVIGGGSAMDTAKLAVVLAAGSEPRYAREPRSGLALLSRATGPAPALIAFPTTLGTGSETSTVARLPLGARRSRLVCSPALRPTAAVLDPCLTATLPPSLLAAGALELLLRLTGPLMGPHRIGTAAAAWMLECAATVRHTADTLLAAGPSGPPGAGGTAEPRAYLAMLSAASHHVWPRVGMSPFAFLLWYFADTAATVTATAKNAALAWLFPAYLERAVRVHERSPWADGPRARRVVNALLPDAGQDPAAVREAAAGLLRRWGITPAPPPGADPAGLGADVVSSWPRALTGISARDAAELYAAASDPAQ
ncbi:iron-containing alcohol dehydrogenase [Streptomyces sp. NRRL B-1677]|nr:iron-containing alcohol dehydrogenase [Streptomyces sp. NRRL B-1677]